MNKYGKTRDPYRKWRVRPDKERLLTEDQVGQVSTSDGPVIADFENAQGSIYVFLPRTSQAQGMKGTLRLSEEHFIERLRQVTEEDVQGKIDAWSGNAVKLSRKYHFPALEVLREFFPVVIRTWETIVEPSITRCHEACQQAEGDDCECSCRHMFHSKPVGGKELGGGLLLVKKEGDWYRSVRRESGQDIPNLEQAPGESDRDYQYRNQVHLWETVTGEDPWEWEEEAAR